MKNFLSRIGDKGVFLRLSSSLHVSGVRKASKLQLSFRRKKKGEVFHLPISITLTVLALPPFGVTAAGLACWIPLFVIAHSDSGGRAAFYGACYGFVIAAYVFLGAFVYSAVVYGLTIIALSAVFGVFLYLASRLLAGRKPLGPLQTAIAWVLMETVCESLRLPFTPVLALTQTPALLQTAELGGQYLVSFLLVAFQASAAMMIVGASIRERLVHGSSALLAVAITVGYAASSAADAWRTGAGSLRAAVVQTDVHPAFTENWKADGQLQNLARMRAESYAELRRLEPGPELVVWPEVWFAGLEMRRGMHAGSAGTGAAMLIGAPDIDEFGRRINAVFSVAANGKVLHRHEKKMLLPLLEDEYAQGSAPEPHGQIAGMPGSLICFESAFSSVARELTLAGARLLAISTSDAYAGPSFLAFMHHDLARIRAIENRRAILRAANGGPSSIIDPSGEVQDRLDLFERGILALDVPLVEHLTVHVRFADWWRLAWIAMLGITAWGLWKNPRAQPRAPTAGSLLGTGVAVLLAAVGLSVFQVRYAASQYRVARPDADSAAYTLGFSEELSGVEWSYDQLTVPERDQSQYAALAYLLREHGVPASGEALLGLAGAPPGDTGLEELAAEFGFAISVEEYAEPALASSLPTPALVELRSGETVVLQELDHDQAAFFSPLRGEHIAIKREAFVETWRGATLRLVVKTATKDKHPAPLRPLQ